MELGKFLTFNSNNDIAAPISWMFIIMVGIVGMILVWSRDGKYRRHRAGLPLGSLGWPFIGETMEFISCGYSSRPESFMDKRRQLYVIHAPLIPLMSCLLSNMCIMRSVYWRLYWSACRAPIFLLKSEIHSISSVVPLFIVTVKSHYAFPLLFTFSVIVLFCRSILSLEVFRMDKSVLVKMDQTSWDFYRE